MESIDQALARIDDGTYGACLACGMAIPIAALRAEAAASECRVCVAARRAAGTAHGLRSRSATAPGVPVH